MNGELGVHKEEETTSLINKTYLYIDNLITKDVSIFGETIFVW